MYLDTGFWGKMTPIINISEVKAKIVNFEAVGEFNVLNGVNRGHCNMFNTWLKSATPIFDFSALPTLKFPSKFTGEFTKGIFGFSSY